MTFNESNTVEQMILDACVGQGWMYVPSAELGRETGEVLVELRVREARQAVLKGGNHAAG